MASMPSAQRQPVYIVDDSPLIRERLVRMLGSLEDVELVGQAASARDAIAGIRRTSPRAVVLDLILLDQSGFEVLRAIHPERPGIAFVVLTGHAGPQYERACRAQGASYFLDKSTQFELVPEILRQIARQQ
jgi:two-component system response regulator DevR